MPPRSSKQDETQFIQLLSAVSDRTPEQLLRLGSALIDAERRIGLIDRAYPQNFVEQAEQLTKHLDLDNYVAPRFVYQPLCSGFERIIVELQSIRVAIGSLRLSSDWDLIKQLLDERAVELGLEARLVVERGRDGLSELVMQRFSIAHSHLETAHELSQLWIEGANPEGQDQELIRLAPYLSARSLAESYTFSIVERSIASVAAATDDGLVVQCDARVTKNEAERIWVHEVLAHVLPRQGSLRSLVSLRAGTRGSGEDEEGRALVLEERYGLLHAERRQDLAIRHRVGYAVRVGSPDLGEQALELVRKGCPARKVARAVCRSLRGGGLAREAVYLPSFIHVQHRLQTAPQLERWMKWGRASIDASAQLDDWLVSNSIVQGA